MQPHNQPNNYPIIVSLQIFCWISGNLWNLEISNLQDFIIFLTSTELQLIFGTGTMHHSCSQIFSQKVGFWHWLWQCDLCLRERWNHLWLKSVWLSAGHWLTQTIRFCSSFLRAWMLSNLTRSCSKVSVLLKIGLQVKWEEKKQGEIKIALANLTKFLWEKN